MKRKTGVIIATSISTILIFASLLFANAFIASLDSAGPLIQMISSNGFRVVWWGSAAVEGSVQVSCQKDNTVTTFYAHKKDNRFETEAKGLLPGLTYDYKIFIKDAMGGKTLWKEGTTKTAKQEDGPFSFSVFGDSGSGSRDQYELAEVINFHSPDFILHVGDLVYRSGETKDYLNKFFIPYKNILQATPFYPVLGNHDVKTKNGKPFLDTFSLPENGPAGIEPERCYSFSYSNALFVGIDSNLDEDILEKLVSPWLLNVLNTSDAMWKFVYFHHPPYSSGKHDGSKVIRDVLVPVIEEGDVDIVFSGHDHNYERTRPILNGRIDDQRGVVYVVTGAGGKSLHSIKHENPYTAAFNSERYSFTHLEIDGGRLTLRQINEEDQIIDELVIEKGDYLSGCSPDKQISFFEG